MRILEMSEKFTFSLSVTDATDKILKENYISGKFFSISTIKFKCL